MAPIKRNSLYLVALLILLFVFLYSIVPWQSKGVNHALYLDGEGRWMEIQDTEQISQPVFTVECGMKLLESGLVVTRDAPDGSPSDWQLWHESGRLAFITAKSPPDEYFFTPRGSIVPGKWHHVALAVNGLEGYARLYLDGELSISPSFSPRSFNANTGLAWAGYYDNRRGAYLKGFLDECRYWKCERSHKQILETMNRRLYAHELKDLAGYWSFCLNYADSSGSGSHGISRDNPEIVQVYDLPDALNCEARPAAYLIASSGDFGDISSEKTTARLKTITIWNSGKGDFRYVDFSLSDVADNDVIEIVNAPHLPGILTSNDTLQITLRIQPKYLGLVRNVLVIHAADDNDFEITVRFTNHGHFTQGKDRY